MLAQQEPTFHEVWTSTDPEVRIWSILVVERKCNWGFQASLPLALIVFSPRRLVSKAADRVKDGIKPSIVRRSKFLDQYLNEKVDARVREVV